MIGCRAQNGVIDSHPLVTLNNVSLQNPYFVRPTKIYILDLFALQRFLFENTMKRPSKQEGITRMKMDMITIC